MVSSPSTFVKSLDSSILRAAQKSFALASVRVTAAVNLIFSLPSTDETSNCPQRPKPTIAALINFAMKWILPVINAIFATDTYSLRKMVLNGDCPL